MRRGFKAECERTSIQFRSKLALLPSDRLPASVLAEHLGIPVLWPENLADLSLESLNQLLKKDSNAWSAITLVAGEDIAIVCNSTHSSARTESNIMHEMAHIILGHNPTSLIEAERIPYPVRQYNQVYEDEAACLGGALQIPREGLLNLLSRGMSSQEIAVHFGASQEMVQYRRNITGVDNQLQRRRKRRR